MSITSYFDYFIDTMILTCSRLILSPIILILILYDYYSIGAVLFVIAVLTDLIDGYTSRFKNEISSFEENLDAFADLMLMFICLLGFTINGNITWTVPIVVAGYYFILTVLSLKKEGEFIHCIPSRITANAVYILIFLLFINFGYILYYIPMVLALMVMTFIYYFLY